MDTLRIARIRDGIVVNIEAADREWLDAQTGPDLLVPVGDEIAIGSYYEDGIFTVLEPLTPPSEESLEWAAANGDTSWQEALAARGVARP